MFKSWCFTEINGWHTPSVALKDAEEAFAYCKLQHLLFPEIRITDDGDFIVMHVINHTLKVPMPDGSLKEIAL